MTIVDIILKLLCRLKEFHTASAIKNLIIASY